MTAALSRELPPLGNDLHGLTARAKLALFAQGELAELTFSAFDNAVRVVQSSELDEITVNYPVGYLPTKQTISGSLTYSKDALIQRYEFLASTQLALNGIVQLITIVEALLEDVIRAIIRRYPNKLGAKRTIQLSAVFEAGSLEELHMNAADTLINELSYKSPKDFAEAISDILSLNLLECPAFHAYAELKATRDVMIHNRGISNATYTRKAGPLGRALAGQHLPVSIQYFLESYEACLKLVEWLQSSLHERWHSQNFEEQQLQLQLGNANMSKLDDPPSEHASLDSKVAEEGV